jgi:large subunit ribosomal protein L7Ae
MPATTEKTQQPAAQKKDTKKAAPKQTKGVSKQKKATKAALYKNLFVARPKNFSIGGDAIPPQYLDLTRFVKWPKYVRLQRQKRILLKRLRVPPAINQFTRSAAKPLAARVIKFLQNYRPEDKAAKKTRLRQAAEAKAKEGAAPAAAKKAPLRFGLNEVVKAVERQKAQLVVIAHDVDPIELVVYLPALCKKMNVPYIIIKSKSRIGQLVHQKNTSAVALTEVRKEDREEFASLVDAVRGSFNERYLENARTWGGTKLSKRSRYTVDRATRGDRESKKKDE